MRERRERRERSGSFFLKLSFLFLFCVLGW